MRVRSCRRLGVHALEVLDECVDQIRNRVALRHDVRLDSELLRGFGRHRTDRRDDGRAQQIRRLFLTENLGEVPNRDALVKVTASI